MNEYEELKIISASFLQYALLEAPKNITHYELFNSWVHKTGINIRYENNFRWAIEFARSFKTKILPYKNNLIDMLKMKGDI